MTNRIKDAGTSWEINGRPAKCWELGGVTTTVGYSNDEHTPNYIVISSESMVVLDDKADGTIYQVIINESGGDENMKEATNRLRWFASISDLAYDAEVTFATSEIRKHPDKSKIFTINMEDGRVWVVNFERGDYGELPEQEAREFIRKAIIGYRSLIEGVVEDM